MSNTTTTKYEYHPISGIFPMMEKPKIEELAKRIAAEGLQEQPVLYEGKILDGRNREEACEMIGLRTDPIDWDSLSEEIKAAGPTAFVMNRNFHRRHLTPSQLAACATEALPFFEAEAKARMLASLKQNKAKSDGAQDEYSQETGYDESEESQVRGRKGKSAKHAAEKFGVSTSSVEKAKRLKKRDPKKFEKVKAGKEKLGKAARDEAKEAKKKEELESAQKRIRAICGRGFDLKVLKNRKETLAYAEMREEDMLKTRGLIESGWSVSKARAFKATQLRHTHKIKDLLDRTIAARGKFETDVIYGDSKFFIKVSRAE